MKLLLFIIAIAGLVACGSRDSGRRGTAYTQNADTVTRAQNIVADSAGDIVIKIEASQLPLTIHQNIRSDTQRCIIRIQHVNARRLLGAIRASGGNRNIRFNQIIMPDATADGPFTDSIDYRLRKKGNYELLIGKDLMAEGILKGAFAVSISLQ